jgi:hypothetical protein
MLLRLAMLGLILTGCADDAPVDTTCDYEGTIYADGEEFPASDGCNSCKCNPTGATPGEWGCSLVDCEALTCPNAFVEQYACPSQCAQEPFLGVPPFWCATLCDDTSQCNGFACHPDGYCVPTCTSDFDCEGAFGSFDHCDTPLGLCTFDAR